MLIEHWQKTQMETLLSLLIQLESLEIMHRNGELLKI